MTTEILKLSCFERLILGKEGTEKIRSFHQDIPDYINRAVAGENKYDLQIDKDWTQFFYESSKMCWKKILVLLIGMAPSFTKFPSFFARKVLIEHCTYYPFPTDKIYTLEDCIEWNGGSQWYDKQLFSTELSDLVDAILHFLKMAIPQWIFLALIWTRFRNSKYTVWMSSGKIHLTTFSKRVLTLGYYFGVLVFAVVWFFMWAGFQFHTEKLFASTSQISITSTDILWISFDRSIFWSYIWSYGTILSHVLVYSCLLTALIGHIREPIAFFTGFRMYLKKASAVPYNTASVDFRIKKDSFNWRCIKMYYEQCQRYSPHIVLNALTTHLLDLKILQIDKTNQWFDKIKSE